jgi:hypothetical protein
MSTTGFMIFRSLLLTITGLSSLAMTIYAGHLHGAAAAIGSGILSLVILMVVAMSTGLTIEKTPGP